MALQQRGLELGEVSLSDTANQKGNRESAVLTPLHESVLRQNGGSWKHPRWPNRWSAEAEDALRQFIADMDQRYEHWGFKDPRALMVLDEWQRQVPDRLQRVGIYRHPMAVHRSLIARRRERGKPGPGFSEERSFAIWRRYNERLVAEHERAAFPLLRFDIDTRERERAVDIAAAVVGLRARGADDAFDAELVHNDDAAQSAVPDTCRDIWDELESRRQRV
jgi:hypothetical protein